MTLFIVKCEYMNELKESQGLTAEKDVLLGASASDGIVVPTVDKVNEFIDAAVSGKQDTLVSGTNIKTVNGSSILGSGNMAVGTITGINMNGASKGTSGVVDLGTVITSHQDISGKENITNKTTSVSSASTDTQYPSAKAVYDSIVFEKGSGANSAQLKGTGSMASGAKSVAEGGDNIQGQTAPDTGSELLYARAEGYASHAEGAAHAIGKYSHAEGGGDSIQEGYKTVPTAEGSYSHAEGTHTYAKGSRSHAEGLLTQALGDGSHVEGYKTRGRNANDHAEGLETVAEGWGSHVEGELSEASAARSHAEGYNTKTGGSDTTNSRTAGTVAGGYSHAEGNASIANGQAAHAEGTKTLASNHSSHAEGYGTIAGTNAEASFSEDTTVGYFSPSEGNGTKASGNSSHAEGAGTVASNNAAHAEGRGTTASGLQAHAEGLKTEASGDRSHAEGCQTIASGMYAHAENANNHAIGGASHAEGRYTKALNDFEHAEGYYNFSHNGSGTANKTRSSIGIGTSDESRKNAFEVMGNGDAYLYGVGGYDGTNGGGAGVGSTQSVINGKVSANINNFQIKVVSSQSEVGSESNILYIVVPQN